MDAVTRSALASWAAGRMSAIQPASPYWESAVRLGQCRALKIGARASSRVGTSPRGPLVEQMTCPAVRRALSGGLSEWRRRFRLRRPGPVSDGRSKSAVGSPMASHGANIRRSSRWPTQSAVKAVHQPFESCFSISPTRIAWPAASSSNAEARGKRCGSSGEFLV